MPRVKREFPTTTETSEPNAEQEEQANPLDEFAQSVEPSTEVVISRSVADLDEQDREIERKRVEMEKKLSVPIPANAIKKVKGSGGKFYDYVDGAYVIRKLNEIFGMSWHSAVESITVGEQVVYAVVSIAQNYNTRTDVGVGVINGQGGQALDTAIKGAVTDGLKRAARQFGEALGLSLYPDVTAEQQPQAVETSQQEDNARVQPRPAPRAQQSDAAGLVCELCGTAITGFGELTASGWADIMRRKYDGQVLCTKHYRERKAKG